MAAGELCEFILFLVVGNQGYAWMLGHRVDPLRI